MVNLFTSKVVLLLALFTVGCVAAVSTSSDSAGLKVGVVSVQKIMSSDASKASEGRVQQIQKEQETLIKKMDEDLAKQAKTIESKSKLADLDTLEKEQEKFADAKNKRDLAAKSATEKIQRAVSKEMERMTKLVQDAAQSLLKSMNLDLVLAAETGAVLAHSSRVDLTNSLISEIVKNQAAEHDTTSKPAVKA